MGWFICLRFLIWVACIGVSLKKVEGTPKGSRHAVFDTFDTFISNVCRHASSHF